jgi:hypothetical protein
VSSRKEEKMFLIIGCWIAVLFICLIIKIVFVCPDMIREIIDKEDTVMAESLASHSCFEEEEEYPFSKGMNTPEEEFYRRVDIFKSRGGIVSQRACDRIADDISAEVKSMRGRRSDRDSEKIF